MKTRSLRWRLTWVSVKCVLVAWLVWLGCQAWQLSRAHYGFWDESQREVAAQILQSMPDGLQSLPPRERPVVPAGHRDHKMSWQVWASGRNVVYSVAAPDEEATRDPKEPFPFLLDVSRPTMTVYEAQSRATNRPAVIPGWPW